MNGYQKKNDSILVLNNSHSEADIILILLKKGFNVITTGRVKPYIKNKNLIHYIIDYTEHKKIKKIVSKYNVKFIFPSANDLSIITSYKLAKRNNDDLKIIKILHDKFKFRKFYNKIKFNLVNDINKIKINFPYLLKPITGSGGKGIIFIRNKYDASKIKIKKYKKKFIAEEYICGSDHGIFTLIKDKKIIFSFFDSEQRYINPFTVSSTSSFSNLKDINKKFFLKEVDEIIKKLNLIDGILHFQVKFNTNKKKFYIIEVTRRIPGDMYLRFMSFSLNISLEENIVNLLLKKRSYKFEEISTDLNKNNFIIRKILMAPKNGKFFKILISHKIRRNIIEKNIFVKKGETINDFLNKRVGIIFLKFNNKKKLNFVIKNLDNFLKVIVF